MSTTTSIADLPDECLTLIFEHAVTAHAPPLACLGRWAQVCRTWARLVHDNRIWYRVYKRVEPWKQVYAERIQLIRLHGLHYQCRLPRTLADLDAMLVRRSYYVRVDDYTPFVSYHVLTMQFQMVRRELSHLLLMNQVFRQHRRWKERAARAAQVERTRCRHDVHANNAV